MRDVGTCFKFLERERGSFGFGVFEEEGLVSFCSLFIWKTFGRERGWLSFRLSGEARIDSI